MSDTQKPTLSAQELAHSLVFVQTPGSHGSQLSQSQSVERADAFPFHSTRLHRARLVTVDSEVPTWFWLTFLGLGALALSLVCWGAYRSLSEEKFLRVADKAPTLGLTGTRVAAGPVGDPEPARIALKEELPPAPPPLPTVDPPPLLFKPNPVAELPPLPPLPAVPVPVVPPPDEMRPVVNLETVQEVNAYPLCYTRALPNEDTPMLRNWKMLALYSLTIVTLAQPAQVVAGDQKLLDRLDNLEKSIKKSFDDFGGDIKMLTTELIQFKKDLGKIQSDITGLQADTIGNKLKIDGFMGKLESLEKQVQKMQMDMDALRRRLDTEPRAAAPLIDKEAVEEVRLKLGAIEKAILSLQPTTPRVALSPGATAETKARVMLVNNYPETLLFIINNREFRVPGMSTQPIDGVPAGALEYEVISPTWGSRARRTTTLASGETFTLTAQ